MSRIDVTHPEVSSVAKDSGAAPAPFTPPDCDLRHLPYMPLHVVRLRDSSMVDAVDGEAFRAAVLLWSAAWHQVPAGSLPDDDLQLAKLAGFGRVVSEWLKLRASALHGFVKCSDGRLYHTVIAEIAHSTFEETKKLREQRAAAKVRSRKHRDRVLHGGDELYDEETPIDAAAPAAANTLPKGNAPVTHTQSPRHAHETSPSREFSSEEKGREENGSEENRIELNSLSAAHAPQREREALDLEAKQGQGASASASTARDIAAVFEEFWCAYPPAPNASKEKARAIFLNLVESGAGPPPLALIAAAKAYAAHVGASVAQRRPNDPLRVSHPSNWLAEKRYDFWLAAAAKPGVDASVPVEGAPDIGNTPLLRAARAAFIETYGANAWHFYLAPCRLVEGEHGEEQDHDHDQDQDQEEQSRANSPGAQNSAHGPIIRLRAPTPFIATYARKTFGPTLRTLNIDLLPP